MDNIIDTNTIDTMFDNAISTLTKTTVIVKLSVEGCHNFPGAKTLFPEVAFLADRHRHVFHFTVSCGVQHANRDREFIMLKRDIIDYLRERYYDSTTRTHEFGSNSCEMLSSEILTKFNCSCVEVWEDNENGARVERV